MRSRQKLAGVMRRNEVFAWNPRRPIRPGVAGKLLPVRRRVNNFGDLLGPLITEWMLSRRWTSVPSPRSRWQLLTVGSVMHFARNGAVIWGTGVNGKIAPELLRFTQLDVRAVRGPLTAEVLGRRNIAVPAVFGDPGLLVAQALPHLARPFDEAPTYRVAVLRSLNDDSPAPPVRDGDIQLDPRRPLEEVIRAIAHSEFVVSSSLHGLVVADAFGVRSRMLMPEAEHRFKYDDYYAGTGRNNVEIASSFEMALEMGGAPTMVWDPSPLMAAFPYDLWA